MLCEDEAKKQKKKRKKKGSRAMSLKVDGANIDETNAGPRELGL